MLPSWRSDRILHCPKIPRALLIHAGCTFNLPPSARRDGKAAAQVPEGKLKSPGGVRMTRLMRSATWKLSMWWGQRRRMSFNAMHAPRDSAPPKVARGKVCTGMQVWPPGRKIVAAAACATFPDEPSEYTHTVSASEACVRAAAAVQFQLARSTSLSAWVTGSRKRELWIIVSRRTPSWGGRGASGMSC